MMMPWFGTGWFGLIIEFLFLLAIILAWAEMIYCNTGRFLHWKSLTSVTPAVKSTKKNMSQRRRTYCPSFRQWIARLEKPIFDACTFREQCTDYMNEE